MFVNYYGRIWTELMRLLKDPNFWVLYKINHTSWEFVKASKFFHMKVWVSLVVNRTACLPSIPKIWVRIPLKSTTVLKIIKINSAWNRPFYNGQSHLYFLERVIDALYLPSNERSEFESLPWHDAISWTIFNCLRQRNLASSKLMLCRVI